MDPNHQPNRPPKNGAVKRTGPPSAPVTEELAADETAAESGATDELACDERTAIPETNGRPERADHKDADQTDDLPRLDHTPGEKLETGKAVIPEPDTAEPDTAEPARHGSGERAAHVDAGAEADAEPLGEDAAKPVANPPAVAEDAKDGAGAELLDAGVKPAGEMEASEMEASDMEADHVEAPPTATVETEVAAAALEIDTAAVDDAPVEPSPETSADDDDPEQDAPPGSSSPARSPLVMNAVKIRGRPGGVAIEIGEGDWAELIGVLRERLEIAEGFFRGGRVVLDLGDRAVAQAELEQAFAILTDFEMQMALVRSGAERTLESAAALGVSATTGEPEDPLRGVVEAHSEEEETQEPDAYFVHQGNLRSGQVLQRVESVLVIGDVNPGAQVVSNGDVLIWGRLRGSVHAGAEGDEQAMVTALEFAPTQLRIAGLTSVPPEEKKSGVKLLFWKKDTGPSAEFAYTFAGRIYVEPWNATKPGSLTSRRRR